MPTATPTRNGSSKTRSAARNGSSKRSGQTQNNQNKTQQMDMAGQIRAINKVMAVIEFKLDGTILTANDNFLNTLGYTLDEVQGHHHRMFVDPAYAQSPDYREFWDKLNRGEFQSDEFKRIGKNGKEVWIQASYNPIFDEQGKPFKVVKYATDVTAAKLRNANFRGQLDAISKSQAVIEFNMDGSIIHANDNFLSVVGYTLDEIKGKHHRIFAEPKYAQSPEYQEFWAKLNRGEFQSAEYKRLGKGGKVVWLQASYNPILDPNGDPFKVVKYASDITAQRQEDQLAREVLKNVSGVLKQIASSDLTVRMEGKYEDEYAELQTNVNKAANSLQRAMLDVADSAGQVGSASSQISEGAQKVAEGASNQASSIEEISASLQEMQAMTTQNADHAGEASNLASQTVTSVDKGNGAMVKMEEAINKIKTSSDQTAKIVKTIDEIAFQTNLLALNAAVEAARAGDAGKGFAVVAEEVRALAQRSAEAAKNTAELIEGAVKDAEGGVKITDEVRTILTDIVDGSKKVNDLITEIASASKEQADGIKQITEGVTTMDKVTQENSANSEESAAAATQLNQQALRLNEMIDQFSLGQPSAAPTAKVAPAPAAARQSSARTNGSSAQRPEQVIPLDADDLSSF